MTAVGATAVVVTAVRNNLKSKTIDNIGSTIILWWSLFIYMYVALSDSNSMKFQQLLGPFHMDLRTTMHGNGLLTIF